MPKRARLKRDRQHSGELNNEAHQPTEQTSAEDEAIDAAIKRSIDQFGA